MYQKTILLFLFSCLYWQSAFGQEQPESEGLKLMRIGDYAAAIDAYTKALELEPTNAIFYHNRGLSYFSLDSLNLALADLNQSIDISPISNAFNTRGEIKQSLNDDDGALQDFDRAIELDNTNFKFYFNRGNIYYQQEKISTALTDFQMSISLDQNFKAAYIPCLDTHRRLGEFKEAIQVCDQALRIDSTWSDIYFHRAYCHFEMKNYSQSIFDNSNGFIFNKTNIKAYKNRGWSYLYAKRFESAKNDFSIYLKTYPKDASAYVARGLAQLQLDARKKACKDFQKAVDLGDLKIQPLIDKHCF